VSKLALARFEKLSEDQKFYFLKALRTARYSAQKDAEDFLNLCFVFEELGLRLAGVKRKGLGSYDDFYKEIFKFYSYSHISLMDKFYSVVRARNDAAHQGAFARAASIKAQLVSIELEAIIMSKARSVRQIMSEDVVWAEEFFTVAKVREIMLLNSFSYLPCHIGSRIYLISDAAVADVWNRDQTNEKRNEKLYSATIKELFSLKEIGLESPVEIIHQDAEISRILEKLGSKPVLVSNDKFNKNIVGIVTAFDYL
jgi:predicted transcriptional regulator